MASKQRDTERAEAIARLREWVSAGDTVYTVLRHVSASGMSRSIDLYVFAKNERTGDCEPLTLTWNAAKAMGMRVNVGKHEGIKIGGCGMDMGFALVYDLARTLYPDGVPCAGKDRCHSNDHVNSGPERDVYGDSVIHSDGGYAFRHRWLG